MNRDGHGPRLASSTVATGAATAFIALAAMLGLMFEPGERSDRLHLRGSLAPDGTQPPPPRSSLPAAVKPV